MQLGYEIDANNKVISLSTLWASTKYFEKIFGEKHIDTYSIYSISIVDYILGDYITDYTQPHNTRSENVNPETVRTDVRKFKICYVFEVKFRNSLQIMDKKYYYIIFRKKWYNRWADMNYPRLTQHLKKDGITVKTDIILDAVSKGINREATLVLVMEDCSIWYANMYDLGVWGDKIGVITDKWNQQCIGIPKSMFSEKDPNVYP
jgi:hypothetical protein